MKKWVKILITLAIIGIAGFYLVYHFVYNKKHPDYENLKPAFSVTAGELYTAFKTGKTEAGRKYNGQIIELRGTMDKLEKTDTLVVAVFVLSQGTFGDEGVRCTMLTGYDTKAGAIQKGSALKIKGYCTGFNDTDVILEHCSLVK
jgi:hypothetical protein